MTTMAPMMVMMPTAHLRTDPRVHEPGQPGQVPDRPRFDPGRRRNHAAACSDLDVRVRATVCSLADP